MDHDYDIAIIGGGIHGAACALEATLSGYKVVLLEQYEKPGLATSSKSSKLIHGGLRYLETAQFKLVRECLQERTYLLKKYPHLVKLVPFHLPVYKNTSRRPWLIRLGLIIYSLFSKKSFKSIAKENWNNLDNLKIDNLQAVFQYYDAQTDDKLLTQAIMTEAEKSGLILMTNTTFKSAIFDDKKCQLTYAQNNEQQKLTSKIIINATGPWVNHVLKEIQPAASQLKIDLVLGTHIIIPGQLNQGMYYLEAPQDKRAVFVMPWGKNTMIGTTEVIFNDSPEKVQPPESDIEYLLTVYNHYFKNTLSKKDVIESFAGLRVLPADDKSAFSRSRDTIVHHNDEENPKIFTLYGGKLTAHRATAKQLMRTVVPYLK
jgi:glycerol-3-phosphate dehydrogenase